MSEILDFCLSLQPVPGLSVAFRILNSIWQASMNVQFSKERMKTLATCIAELLIALQEALKSRQVSLRRLQDRIDSLESLLNEIAVFIKKHSKDSWINWFLNSQDRDSQMEDFYWRVYASCAAFQITSSISTQQWQSRQSQAAEQDRRDLASLMEECLSNQQKLHDLLESQHASVLARLDALDHTNQQIVRNAQESSFIRRSRSALEGMRKSAGTGATTDVGLAYLERRELPNTVKTSSSRPSSSNHQERNANPLGSGEQPTQRTRSRTTNVYSLPQHDVPPQPPSYPTPSSYPCPQQVLTSNEHEVELRFCTPDSKDSEAAQLAKAILSSALYGDGTGSPTHTTLLKLFDLGRSLGADKRHDEAVEILEQVLIRGKSVRGFADHHLDVLACVMKCGHGFSKESRHSESEKAYTLAWVGREEILGPRHVDTLSALYGIGIALRGQGREGEALKVLLPCLDAQKGILGSSHELVGRTHYWIGKCRVDQRDYHEAELRFGEAYAILKRALGERNLETLKILQNRGTNLTKQGRNAEALVMLNQVRSLGEDVFDRNSTTMTKTHYWLGRTFENMSRWAEAEDAYSDAYRRSLACPDYERDHPSTAKIKERLDASRVQLRLLNCQQSTTNGERGGMFGKLPT